MICEFIIFGMYNFGSIGRFFFSSLLFCIFVATVYPFHALLKFILYPFSVKICYCHKKVMSIIIIIHSLGLSQLGQSMFEFIFCLKKWYFVTKIVLTYSRHNMARANLNKSKRVLTFTNTASKYIPKRSKISNMYQLKSPFQTSKTAFLLSKSCFKMLTFRGTFTK